MRKPQHILNLLLGDFQNGGEVPEWFLASVVKKTATMDIKRIPLSWTSCLIA
jgi:hypothetical protein